MVRQIVRYYRWFSRLPLIELSALHHKSREERAIHENESHAGNQVDTLSDVNDLGKPWRYTEDGLTVTRSSVWSPPGCHPVGCGLKLFVDDNGRLVRVEGDENHPVTQGRLCPRCIALKDYVYNPSRIVFPMKRDPEFRGQDDKWERITWDEALDIIENAIRP
jgi:hypothetical protein